MHHTATPVWDRITRRADRNARPRLLAEAIEQDVLPAQEFIEAVCDAWVMAEEPEKEFGLGFWVPLFESCGFTRDGIEVEKPKEPQTLYRGAGYERERRMSWTDDLEMARWFAARAALDGPLGFGQVLRARVQPWRLLAQVHVSGRKEAEWVIDPRRLRIEVVESDISDPPMPDFDEMRRRIVARS